MPAASWASSCPSPGYYGVAMVYLPPDEAQRRDCQARLEAIVAAEGQQVLGWRTVPTDDSELGATTRAAEPAVRQLFIARSADTRRRHGLRAEAVRDPPPGGEGDPLRRGRGPRRRALLHPQPLLPDGDLQGDADVRAAGGLLPGPDRPGRWRAAWPWSTPASAPTPSPAGTGPTPTATSCTTARSTPCAATSTGCRPGRPMFSSALFGDDLPKLLPGHRPRRQRLRHVRQLPGVPALAGRSLPHAIMMMIPEPWSNHEDMDRGEAGLLRVPQLPDGAVGRPRLHRLHRRRR